MIAADDLATWLQHQPAASRAAYCTAWHYAPREWLAAWQPGQRAQVRLVMNRVCRG